MLKPIKTIDGYFTADEIAAAIALGAVATKSINGMIVLRFPGVEQFCEWSSQIEDVVHIKLKTNQQSK